MKAPLIKITELDGYYATGDYECFCFDRHANPEQHLASKKSRSMVEDEALQLFYDQKAQEMFGVNYDDLKDGRARQVCEVLEQEHDFFGDACRVYPNDLLPWDTEDRRKQRGRWRITVEFWPKEKE